jgi:cytochrome c peroxidase
MDTRGAILIGLVSAVLGAVAYAMASPISWTNGADQAAASDGDREAIVRAYQGPQETWPTAVVDSSVEVRPLARLSPVEHPPDNAYSDAKRNLGKVLFFDPRMSASGTLACASCHDPDLGWSDGRQRSFGHARRKGKRNSMTILNAGYFDDLFWDGRAESLEDQALVAINGPAEMNMGLDTVAKRLDSIEEYAPLFRKSFGDDTVSPERIAKAIATFERGITSRTSAFDRFLSGDRDAMTDEQIHGLHLFRTKASCMNCHNGALLSDGKFHNLGQSHLARPSQDLGRYLVTGDTSDVGKFRTPSLRDVTYTGPYLHHGLIFSLREVIDMYNAGMPQVIPRKAKDHPLYPEKSPLLKPLGLSEAEKEALVAFLEAVSRRPRRISAPELPGHRKPQTRSPITSEASR